MWLRPRSPTHTKNGSVVCFCLIRYYGEKCEYHADRFSILFHLDLILRQQEAFRTLLAHMEYYHHHEQTTITGIVFDKSLFIFLRHAGSTLLAWLPSPIREKPSSSLLHRHRFGMIFCVNPWITFSHPSLDLSVGWQHSFPLNVSSLYAFPTWSIAETPRIARRLILVTFVAPFSIDVYELFFYRFFCGGLQSHEWLCVLQISTGDRSLSMTFHLLFLLIHSLLPFLINLS